TAQAFHFILVRLWFGGGQLFTYSVDQNSKTQVIDKVDIDLKRWVLPQIDQHKMILPPKGPTQPPEETKAGTNATAAAKTDTTTTGKQILNQPAPGSQAPPPPPTPKKKSTRKP